MGVYATFKRQWISDGENDGSATMFVRLGYGPTGGLGRIGIVCVSDNPLENDISYGMLSPTETYYQGFTLI